MKITVKKRSADYKEIVINEPTVENMIKAEKMSDGDRGFEFAVCLLSLIAEFDGQKLPPEEIKKLPASVFLEISRSFMELGLTGLGEQLSTSQSQQAGN
ncbi:phage tail assembly protein [Desulfurobacterium sp.]